MNILKRKDRITKNNKKVHIGYINRSNKLEYIGTAIGH